MISVYVGPFNLHEWNMVVLLLGAFGYMHLIYNLSSFGSDWDRFYFMFTGIILHGRKQMKEGKEDYIK